MDRKPKFAESKSRRSFTLVELLVSITILLFIMSVLLAVTAMTGKMWTRASGKIEQFRGARDAFEDITRRLGSATLNTYWDYETNSAGLPTGYARQSALRFISGQATSLLAGVTNSSTASPGTLVTTTHAIFFQAPMGYTTNSAYTQFENLLNTWGYYIEFGDNSAQSPTFFGSISPYRYRYRLRELMEPTDNLTIYQYTSTCGTNTSPNYVGLNYTGHQWFTTPVNQQETQARAENIIAFIVLPKLSVADESALSAPPTVSGTALCPNYSYDSTLTNNYTAPAAPAAADSGILDPKNQLPPVVQVTMVAIDEASAIRLQQQNGTSPPNFGLSSLFTNSTQYSADLSTLQTTLTNMHVTYRVFTTEVLLKGAKWSTAETN